MHIIKAKPKQKSFILLYKIMLIHIYITLYIFGFFYFFIIFY